MFLCKGLNIRIVTGNLIDIDHIVAIVTGTRIHLWDIVVVKFGFMKE